ncbi:hypothetical protein Pla123a_33270 [Posidoniimonas polymericola]|uniref:Uncharacterized protein n=1 Tax=Posidoniimonas polymericola TaxID=2528002 RepID=A0A5C5YH09_9BACT|nr:hypothetical protein [Posidoniimonas polymericola]TWT74504.1 hypothetical protein Pla123a_33270 [Posidoniimonas polymericola]
MTALLRTADDILRRAPWTTAPHDAGRAVPRLAGCVVAFACVYGAAMGAYRGFNAEPQWALQMAYSAIKAPLLLGGSFLLTLPAFFTLSSLLGLRDSFGQMVRALVAGQAALAIALAAFAPLTLLAYASSPDYDFARAFNAVVFATAALAGQSVLRRHCRPLIEQNRRHRTLLVAWGGVYAFVAIQLAWLLRPFFGASGLAVRFLREEAWDNAYVQLARIVWRAVVGE